ncbi:hypothetical protein HYU14_01015 [Candidatus Woesearchaeota archaeon]|nr:hypothetical protein [Candidatus Woesearchaeota archaeon]
MGTKLKKVNAFGKPFHNRKGGTTADYLAELLLFYTLIIALMLFVTQCVKPNLAAPKIDDIKEKMEAQLKSPILYGLLNTNAGNKKFNEILTVSDPFARRQEIEAAFRTALLNFDPKLNGELFANGIGLAQYCPQRCSKKNAYAEFTIGLPIRKGDYINFQFKLYRT